MNSNELIYYDLPNYNGIYKINHFGDIYSIRKKKLLKHDKSTLYNTVTLAVDKINIRKTVHRLVAETFIPNPENKPCVNHKDGNKRNNHVSNLEWVTYSENEQHSFRILGKKISHSFETRQRQRIAGLGRDTSKAVAASILSRKNKKHAAS